MGPPLPWTVVWFMNLFLGMGVEVCEAGYWSTMTEPCYGQTGFGTDSVHQCKFDSNGDGACKWTLKQDAWQMILTFTQLCNVIFTRGARWRRMNGLQFINGSCLIPGLLQSKLSTFPAQLVLKRSLYVKVVRYKEGYEYLVQSDTVMCSTTSFVRPPVLSDLWT